MDWKGVLQTLNTPPISRGSSYGAEPFMAGGAVPKTAEPAPTSAPSLTRAEAENGKEGNLGFFESLLASGISPVFLQAMLAGSFPAKLQSDPSQMPDRVAPNALSAQQLPSVYSSTLPPRSAPTATTNDNPKETNATVNSQDKASSQPTPSIRSLLNYFQMLKSFTPKL